MGARIRQWFDAIARKFSRQALRLSIYVLVGTVLNLLIIAVGAYASFYSTQISKVFTSGWTREAVVFVVLLGISSVLFFGHRLAGDLRLERQSTELSKNIVLIPQIVRTQPPTTFLRELGVTYENLAVATRTLFEGATQSSDTSKQVIRSILQGVARLAKHADQVRQARPEALYAANVMLFLPPDKATNCKIRPKFIEYETDVAKLRGVLVLTRALSATAASDKEDDKLEEFSLPVPAPDHVGGSKEASKGGWRVLPGAPYSFVQKRFDSFSDTTTMADWAEKHGNFSDTIVTEIRDYFIKYGMYITSFLSVPLFKPTAVDAAAGDNREVCGILNVHWNNDGILKTPEVAQNFCESLAPLQCLLAEVICKYEDQLMLDFDAGP